MEKIQIQSLSFASGLEILEQSSAEEIEKIAELARIELPSPDVKFVKARLLFTDEANLNGCILPDNEVDKALDTLVGKALDINHWRSEIIGQIDAYEKKDNEVVIWGHLWVSNFMDKAEKLYTDFLNEELTISFEAWGRKIDKNDGNYEFVDLHFCGAGILEAGVNPAYPKAKVLEFAKEKYGDNIELVNGETHEITKQEHAKLYMEDLYTITKFAWDFECPNCKELGLFDIRKINLDDNELEVECTLCNSRGTISFTPKYKEGKKGEKPQLTEVKQGRFDIKVEVSNQEKNKDGGSDSMDEAKIQEIQEESATLKTQVEKLTADVADYESAKAETDAKIEELEEKVAEVEEAKTALETERDELKEKVDAFETEKREAEEAEKAKRIEEIKETYGELTDEYEDSELLDEKVQEILKLKTELSKTEKAKEEIEVSGEKEEKTDIFEERREKINSAVKNIKDNKRS